MSELVELIIDGKAFITDFRTVSKSINIRDNLQKENCGKYKYMNNNRSAK